MSLKCAFLTGVIHSLFPITCYEKPISCGMTCSPLLISKPRIRSPLIRVCFCLQIQYSQTAVRTRTPWKWCLLHRRDNGEVDATYIVTENKGRLKPSSLPPIFWPTGLICSSKLAWIHEPCFDKTACSKMSWVSQEESSICDGTSEPLIGSRSQVRKGA